MSLWNMARIIGLIGVLAVLDVSRANFFGCIRGELKFVGIRIGSPESFSSGRHSVIRDPWTARGGTLCTESGKVQPPLKGTSS